MQAIGVILGANVGTTVTGWILTLKIGKWGLPILGMAVFVYLFSKNERARYTAMALTGIGMVFFGLETMAAGFKDPHIKVAVESFFAQMSGDTYGGVMMCALTGCVTTMIIQSSSATLGITLALAQTGVIPFNTAVGLIMGLNIGTTITAFLASIGASTNAKRAAYAHIIFNVIGTLWLIPVFYWYVGMIEHIFAFLGMNGLTSKIAFAHTGFNVVNTLAFLPLMHYLARLVERIVPDLGHEEVPHLTFLDVRILDSPAIGIEQSATEVIKMGQHVEQMLELTKHILADAEVDDEKVKKVFHREEVLDIVQKEVTEYIGHIFSGSIPQDVVQAGRMQLRVSDEYESIGDYLASLVKLHLKLEGAEIKLSDVARDEILELHCKAHDYVLMINQAVREHNASILSKANSQGEAITYLMKDLRARHLDRVEANHVSPIKSLIFTDMLTAYRRIKDHTLNIAEALAGEK
jgi:phosphate:Na+ symporter